MQTPDHDAVTARAFALYVRGGRRPGRAIDDWIEAERQLKAEAADAASATRRNLSGVAQPPLPVPAAVAPAALPAPAARAALPAPAKTLALPPAPAKTVAPAKVATPAKKAPAPKAAASNSSKKKGGKRR